jgi:hypothetical protein
LSARFVCNPSVCRRVVAVVLGVGCVLLGVVPCASAVFTRPFLCKLEGVAAPEAVGVDGSDNVWVSESLASVGNSETGGARLYEFGGVEGGMCGKFLGPGSGPAPLAVEGHDLLQSMAIDQTSGGRLYLIGAGRAATSSIVEVFEKSGVRAGEWGNLDLFNASGDVLPGVAIDSAGRFVYVSHKLENPGPPFGDGSPPAVEKFNLKGEAVSFGASGSVGYVSGNRITGTEGASFSASPDDLGALAVDSSGDVFVVFGSVVNEFSPSGVFVRSFPTLSAPHFGLAGDSDVPVGVAVDGVSGHLLVSVRDVSNPGVSVVDEFDVASGGFVSQLAGPGVGGGFVGARALVVDSSGDMTVVDEGRGAVDVFGPGRFLPTVAVGEAGGRTREAAMFEGSVNPEGLKLSECRFEYVDAAVFRVEGFAKAKVVGCEPGVGGIAGDHVVHPVSGAVSGLTPGVKYVYRLAAASEGALGGRAVSGVSAFTAPEAAVVVSESVGSVSSASAVLRAQIGVLGASTAYDFQYVPVSGYRAGAADPYEGGVTVPAVPAGIGEGGPEGDGVESVERHVDGLASGVAYDFRVVARAVVEGGELVGAGGDTSFATLSTGTGLPDGRGYELVTPSHKGGGSDMFARAVSNGEYFNDDDGFASMWGNGFLLETFAGFGPFAGAGKSTYVFSRSAAGWGFVSLTDPALGVQSLNAAVFNPVDFSSVALNDGVGAGASEAGEQLKSLVGPPGGPYTTLHTNPAHHVAEGESEASNTQVVGASANLGVVVLESGLASACKGREEPTSHLQHGDVLCEWTGRFESREGGVVPELELVDAAEGEDKLLSRCGATLGQGVSSGAAHGAVSSDGSQVLFTAPDPRAKGAGPGCWQEEAGGKQLNPPQLYMRTGGQTVRLSAPEAGVMPPAEFPVAFVGAAEDGSRVFFMTKTELTKEAVELELNDEELYECTIVKDAGSARCDLTRVSKEAAGHGSGAGTGTLSAATGTGTLSSGSPEVTEVVTNTGAFAVGQEIRGAGVPVGATVAAVGSGTLTLSVPAVTAGTAVLLHAGSREVREVVTSAGSFSVGQEIEGKGVPAGATVTAVGSGTLMLSAPAEAAGSGVVLHAGAPQVVSVAAVAAGGGAVYFTAFGALAGDAVPHNAVEELVNLYRYDTKDGTTKFVATVNTYDSHGDNDSCRSSVKIVSLCSGENRYGTSDGRYLLFVTTRELTGYATVGPCKVIQRNEGSGNGHCDELYRYDAASGGLVCVSCDPSGAAPVSNALFARSAQTNPSSGEIRAMSDDGQHVFFDTADPLVSQDTNGTLDVYEWEALGAGGCELSQGCVRLISSGTDSAPSYFLGESPFVTPAGRTIEAGNVFIGTHANLVPSESTEGEGNIYDARVCLEEDPCIKAPPSLTGQCEGDACQHPSKPPVDPSAGLLPAVGGVSAPVVVKVTAAQIRAEKLAKALRACKKEPKKKRAGCQRLARRRYGPVKKKTAVKHSSRHGGR